MLYLVVFLLLSLAIYFFGRKLLTVDVVTAHGQLQPFPPLPPRWVLKLAERVVGFFDFLRIALLPAPLVATQMLTDFWKNQATYVVVRLGIPDMIPLALKHGESWPSTDELARRGGIVDADGLYKVMRLLTTAYIFKEHKGRRFSHTKLSVYLRKDHPTSGRHFALCYGAEQFHVWRGLYHSIKTGEGAYPHTHGGLSFWEFLNEPDNKENLENFQAMFDDISRVMTPPLVKDFDWPALVGGNTTKPTIVDVGGGLGGVLALVLDTLPKARGILFDQEKVIEQARKQKRWGGTKVPPASAEGGVSAEIADLSERGTLVAGSFLEDEVPVGGDVYIMRMILHDWSDEESKKILHNVRRAMLKTHQQASKGSSKTSNMPRLVVMETVLPEEGSGPSGQLPLSAEFVDVHMKLMFNGKERSESEFAALFESAGFKYLGTTYTRGTFHIIQGEPLL